MQPLSETLANDPTDPEPDGRSATLEEAVAKTKALRGRDLLWTPTPGKDMTRSLFPGAPPAPQVGVAAERIEKGDVLAFDPGKSPSGSVSVVGRDGLVFVDDPCIGPRGGRNVYKDGVLIRTEWRTLHGWNPVKVYPAAPRKSPIGADGKPECARDDDDKARLDLIPIGPLFEVAKLYQRGAAKYEVDQWRNGLSFRRAASALLRHVFKWLGGQTIDPENGCHHLAAVVFWAFALMEWTSSHPEKDDRVTDPVFAKEGFPRS